MAELATIARPYAEALFKSTLDHAPAAAQWLDELAVVAAHPQLLLWAANPKVSAQQVYELITGLLRQPLPELGCNFLRTVIDNGRLNALPEMARQLHVLINEQSGSADALVYSAYPIDEAALRELAQVLERHFKRPLKLQVEVQPELIGGVRVLVGDEVLDLSVKARLDQMKVALTA
ncbi:F0F1 ATP synthase subunit delta [Serpentinimonas maccroryi]|uniref:F0F1 ATP synthase subunit delta n=1 Tax=Serpentinimonas maccroryi TaxID=1458426 RepID=UPI002033555F|nr:F0F1 ATP synthase subunit delta [Serpentinimonas maccroryi]MCM2479237.1 F0F1 ATP synthase subunit delta [Serpentinimonas maccroryi]